MDMELLSMQITANTTLFPPLPSEKENAVPMEPKQTKIGWYLVSGYDKIDNTTIKTYCSLREKEWNPLFFQDLINPYHFTEPYP